MGRARLTAIFLAATGLGLSATAWAGPVEDMHALFDEYWERVLRENPDGASGLGDLRYNRQWPDRSLEAAEASHTADLVDLRRLQDIDRDKLEPDEALNYDLFERTLENRLAQYRFKRHLLPFNQRGGIQSSFELTERLRFKAVSDYEDWIARLQAFGRYTDQTIRLLTAGMEAGIVHPDVILERVHGQLQESQVDSAEESPFFTPFESMPDDIPAAEQKRLRAEGKAAVEDVVLPALARLLAFFDDGYLAAGRSTVGIYDQPDGREYYAQRVAWFTTTDLTAREIHEIGLAEVKRIRAEMMAIIEEVEFEGSFAEFLEFLRTDPQFYYQTSDELFQAYLAISKRMDPGLSPLFGKLPRAPYGLRAIPESIAPDTTTAYYSRPSADGRRAGFYYVNLYRPEVRPKYEMEALSLHEAVPGHHLQIALAMELGEQPAFRRYGGITAFVEGWALYAESLGEEMGFYTDPYSKFGQLTYEMWRAVRLVVDTGIHELEWDRQKAIDFFAANAAKSEADIINEIDRYIAWPGQALAYKIGELKIKEIRARAESELGEEFDIRAFHDEILGRGAVPLDNLEAHMIAWIEAQKAG